MRNTDIPASTTRKLMRNLSLKAPAKLNVYLKVCYKRNDGFHELETVMLPVSIYDDIQISLLDTQNSDTSVEMKHCREYIPLEKNLAWKAATLFREETDIKEDISISIVKRIPSGAGMGGGSSDAASVLLGLNKLTEINLPLEQLMSFASELGTDIPFFIERKLSVCLGRGERIYPMEQIKLSKRWFAVAVPPIGVNTGAAYGAFSLIEVEESPFKNPSVFLEHWASDFRTPCFNSLYRAAVAVVPKLSEYRDMLPGDNWYMTGSGSAFFTPCENEEESEEIIKRVSSLCTFYTFVVSSI